MWDFDIIEVELRRMRLSLREDNVWWGFEDEEHGGEWNTRQRKATDEIKHDTTRHDTSAAEPPQPASERLGCMATSVEKRPRSGADGVGLSVETASTAAMRGRFGWVWYVTEVTTPYVPPPPPRSAKNRAGFCHALAV